VLQCVEVFCSVLQCVAVCVAVSILWAVNSLRRMARCVSVCCSVWQCFAVCCSVCCSVCLVDGTLLVDRDAVCYSVM